LFLPFSALSLFYLLGLGKTVQALAVLASIIDKGKRGPHLVIAPLAVAHHWETEAKRWFPDTMKVHLHFGSSPGRLERLEDALREDDWDVFVTSHDLALRDFFMPLGPSWGNSGSFRSSIRRLRNIEFEYLIVDEAHRLKNPESRLTTALRNYPHAVRRILLTGTPLSNNLDELWALLNVLNPAIFGNVATFRSWFASPFDGSEKLNNAEKAVIVVRMHTVLRPFFRRRMRADISSAIVSVDEVLVRCPASPLQVALQRYFRTSRRGGTESKDRSVLWALRKICNHPWTLSDAFVLRGDGNVMRDIVRVSGKLRK
jgi:SNF2 family DNA or RNA helicase